GRGRDDGGRARAADGGRDPAAGLIVAATPRRYPLRLLVGGGLRRPRRTGPPDTGGGTVMSIGNGAVTGDRSARGGLRGAVVKVGAAPILLLLVSVFGYTPVQPLVLAVAGVLVGGA